MSQHERAEREALAGDGDRDDVAVGIDRAGVAVSVTDDQLADDVLDEVVVRRGDAPALQLFLRKGERGDEEIGEHLLERVRLGMAVGDGDGSGAVARQQAVVEAEVALQRILRAEHDGEDAQRRDELAAHGDADGDRRGQQQPHRSPQPSPENRGDEQRNRRDADAMSDHDGFDEPADELVAQKK